MGEETGFGILRKMAQGGRVFALRQAPSHHHARQGRFCALTSPDFEDAFFPLFWSPRGIWSFRAKLRLPPAPQLGQGLNLHPGTAEKPQILLRHSRNSSLEFLFAFWPPHAQYKDSCCNCMCCRYN